jgi:histidinol-phosphate phosphatase family protein
MNILNNRFNSIVMVTNQKGIGRQLMSVDDLDNIHTNMKSEIETHGGRVDKIYYCPDLDSHSINRKPNAGMALQAKKDFPAIDFKKSIIVGNKLSDMQFGEMLACLQFLLQLQTLKRLTHTS